MDNAKTAKAIFREARQSRERANPFDTGISLGQVLNISGSSETVQTTRFPTDVIIQHPFLSSNSWIRALPELGTNISARYTPEINTALHLGYYTSTASSATKDCAEGNGLYIELLPGEIETLSSGMTHHFQTSRPVDVREAGLVRSILDGDSSTYSRRAVTYIDTLHQHKVATLDDTHRFGVVRRPVTSVETRIVKAPVEDEGFGSASLASSVANSLTGAKEKPKFAKELSTILVNSDGYLLDYREGNVVENDGTHPVNDWTGKYLRLRKQVFNTEQESTKIEIDSQGNIDISVPDAAESGIRLNVISGSIDAKIGNEISVISTNNFLIKADGSSTLTEQCGTFIQQVDDTITVTSNGDASYQAKKTSTLTVGGFLTNLGQEGNAKHPLLFGDDFIQEFMQLLVNLATHVHPGVAVPSPDLATACINLAAKCPTFVSRNVQTQ